MHNPRVFVLLHCADNLRIFSALNLDVEGAIAVSRKISHDDVTELNRSGRQTQLLSHQLDGVASPPSLRTAGQTCQANAPLKFAKAAALAQAIPAKIWQRCMDPVVSSQQGDDIFPVRVEKQQQDDCQNAD